MATYPKITQSDWNLINEQGNYWIEGGWMVDEVQMWWFLHYPDRTATWALWDGETPEQEPQPAPDPPGKFMMSADDWGLIGGGTLDTESNTITKNSTEYQVEAVEDGEELLAVVSEV